MIIKFYKPYTPSTRYKTVISEVQIKNNNYKKHLLLSSCFHSYGRNNQGKITTRHHKRGHKKRYRLIDFKRHKFNINGKVFSIQYDPNRNVSIALIQYEDNTYQYILHPQNLKKDDIIRSYCKNSSLNSRIGDSFFLRDFSNGVSIHNISLNFLKKGQICRAAGTSAKILAKEKLFILLKLPSGQIRAFSPFCRATLGILSKADYYLLVYGKAGRKAWYGVKPTVRGSAMNVLDHPHGGGEGRASIGKPNPRTPWGKIAFGVKTRKKHKCSDTFIS